MYIITCNVVKHQQNKLIPVITYFYKHSPANKAKKKKTAFCYQET